LRTFVRLYVVYVAYEYFNDKNTNGFDVIMDVG